jgi:hypothetical protein
VTGQRPATGWIAKRTVAPRLRSRLAELVDRALRLRDRHAVARDDDHALGLEQELRHARRVLEHLALRRAGALGGRGALGVAPKPPKMTFRIERFIARHMMMRGSCRSSRRARR